MQYSVVSQSSVCPIQALRAYSLLLPSSVGPSSRSVMVYVTLHNLCYIVLVHSN